MWSYYKYAWFKESREAECTVSGFIGFEQKASIKVKIEAGGTIFAEHKGVGSPEDWHSQANQPREHLEAEHTTLFLTNVD